MVRCSVQGLLALRCPSGLAFDIDKQTCDWKANVKNCEQLESECFYFESEIANLFQRLSLVVQNHALSHPC